MLGVAEALSAGVTTVHNWAHNVRSADHADAELRAMRDVGLRGRFAYGPAQSMPNDQPMDFAGIARVQKDWMPNDLLTMGICSRNVGAAGLLMLCALLASRRQQAASVVVVPRQAW